MTCQARITIHDRFTPICCGAEAVTTRPAWFGEIKLCGDCAYRFDRSDGDGRIARHLRGDNGDTVGCVAGVSVAKK